MLYRTFIILFGAALLIGCQSSSEHTLFTQSSAKPVTGYTSFTEYSQKVEVILRNNRYFLSENPEQEITANMPFELKPKVTSKQTKGILLVHGLGDSPFSFIDIAKELAKQGFLVRTVLLPGHGTRPSDMLNTRQEDWLELVSRQTELLKKDVDDVYLGGFSTGANLTYLYAAQNIDIKGLALFSPAFQPNDDRIKYTPLISTIKPWLQDVNADREDNYVRYMTTPTNGFVQYYHTSQSSLEQLKKATFDRPVFMVLSENDSILDTAKIKTLFNDRFTHKDSRLIWYGSQESGVTGRVRSINIKSTEYQMSNMSHMGILFSPDNPLYGINASHRICNNSPREGDREHCKASKKVWSQPNLITNSASAWALSSGIWSQVQA